MSAARLLPLTTLMSAPLMASLASMSGGTALGWRVMVAGGLVAALVGGAARFTGRVSALASRSDAGAQRAVQALMVSRRAVVVSVALLLVAGPGPVAAAWGLGCVALGSLLVAGVATLQSMPTDVGVERAC